MVKSDDLLSLVKRSAIIKDGSWSWMFGLIMINAIVEQGYYIEIVNK